MLNLCRLFFLSSELQVKTVSHWFTLHILDITHIVPVHLFVDSVNIINIQYITYTSMHDALCVQLPLVAVVCYCDNDND